MNTGKHSLTISRCAIVLCLMALVPACNADEEGCLDSNARNFDLVADRACSDCCTYPDLLLNMLNQWDGEPMLLNVVYETAAGQTVLFRKIRYYLSNIRLAQDDAAFFVDDRLAVTFQVNGITGEKEIIDDVILVDVPSFNYKAGIFSNVLHITSYLLDIGLAEDLQNISAELVPSSHPLSAQKGLWIAEDRRFALGEMVIVRDTSSGLSDTLLLPDVSIALQFDANKLTNIGKNDTIRLKVDYALLFDEVDLDLDTQTEITEKIIKAFPNAVELNL